MSKFQLMVATSVAAFLYFYLSIVSGQAFGPRYESYLCSARRNYSSGFFSCNEDCQLSHGADGGACLDTARINRYNCICGHPTGRPPLRIQQCVDPVAAAAYVELCVMDCRCNHGAVTGQCNFHLNSCFCEGYNPTNEGCPAYSFEHFKMVAQLIFKVKAGKLGPSWLYERFQR